MAPWGFERESEVLRIDPEGLLRARIGRDLDCRLVVVRDCCADPGRKGDMPLDIVIAKQAAVVTMSELASALKSGLHERRRAIDLEKRRPSVTNTLVRRYGYFKFP